MTESNTPLIHFSGPRVSLTSPTAMPLASAFLWNPIMMLQANCRGFTTAQFMQPEPTKYAHAPNIEARTFMQPEQPYYAHHPGRFFYLKDLDSGKLFSVPHEPVRRTADEFSFSADQDRISWSVKNQGLLVEISVCLSAHRPLELWQATIQNIENAKRRLSITPYFPVGFMSWMNQSADYDRELKSIICRSITPYQKYRDYFKHKDFKDLTFFMAEHAPDSFEARQDAFEGEGGLQAPSALESSQLGNSESLYEMPTAAMQYITMLASKEKRQLRFAFGPAKCEAEITSIRDELFGQENGFDHAMRAYQRYVARGESSLRIKTPDPEFDHFVNHWLTRQMFYHGDVNRLSTDPQTRNYLQDNMGQTYVDPTTARKAFIHALSQQRSDGAMPDGILLSEDAELKYINQVPHTDHCVWLPVCISAYLDETNDYELLDEQVGFADRDELATVFDHITRALRWLYQQRDHRGLNYIEQGDWCDPMNMVGYKGKGVSGWLTLGTAYACRIWSEICNTKQVKELADEFTTMQHSCNEAVNTHIWQGEWYARGITDDGVIFGVESDTEAKIFLNPQSWALLSGAASHAQETAAIKAVEKHLCTPYGVQMLAPAYTKMREDVGRVTQKYPGSAENGSVYNHAAAFYVYALYSKQHADRAFNALRQMIPSGERADALKRGQLPVFIPNYYRGAYKQMPRTAGRSSQLFNTGTVHWFYRCLIDGLFGVKGRSSGLSINPQLPSDWPSATLTRKFRDAEFNIHIERSKVDRTQVWLDGKVLGDGIVTNIKAGMKYDIKVMVPRV